MWVSADNLCECQEHDSKSSFENSNLFHEMDEENQRLRNVIAEKEKIIEIMSRDLQQINNYSPIPDNESSESDQNEQSVQMDNER